MSDGFLARWAQRKRAVRQSERPETAPEVEASLDGSGVPADASILPDAVEAKAEADLLASLPSLADLTAETDLTPFLRAGIPAALRNAALRKMWSIDPAIRDFVSEAREYAYDWNTPGSVPGLGPLLPSDDVKAMLGRLFNADPTEEAEPDASQPDANASEAVALAGDPASDLPSAPASIASSATPSDRQGEALAVPASAKITNETKVTTTPVVTKQRLRRHGGAMPT